MRAPIALLAVSLAGCGSGAAALPRPVVEGRRIQVLALPGGFDALECLPLGEALGPVEITRGSAAFLSSPDKLRVFDVVLVSCGVAWAQTPPEGAAAALAGYVEGGGRLMATDLAYPLIETAWPDLIDFEGAGAAAGQPQPTGGAQLGPEGDVEARVIDDGLVRYLGRSSFRAERLQSEWAVMRGVSPDARVFASGVALGRQRPLAIAADYPGGGRVVYASFHGHAREGDPERCSPAKRDDAERALVYLIAYALATAGAESPPRPVAARPPRRLPDARSAPLPQLLEEGDFEVKIEREEAPAPPPKPKPKR